MQKHYDKVPTQGSTNPVKSDGLHQQLATIGSNLDETDTKVATINKTIFNSGLIFQDSNQEFEGSIENGTGYRIGCCVIIENSGNFDKIYLPFSVNSSTKQYELTIGQTNNTSYSSTTFNDAYDEGNILLQKNITLSTDSGYKVVELGETITPTKTNVVIFLKDPDGDDSVRNPKMSISTGMKQNTGYYTTRWNNFAGSAVSQSYGVMPRLYLSTNIQEVEELKAQLLQAETQLSQAIPSINDIQKNSSLENFVSLFGEGIFILERGSIADDGSNGTSKNNLITKNAFSTKFGTISIPSGYEIIAVYYYSSWTDSTTFTFSTLNVVGGQTLVFDETYPLARFSIGKSSGSTKELILSSLLKDIYEPLLAWNKVEKTVGKNLLDVDSPLNTQYAFLTSNGSPGAGNENYKVSEYIKVKPNTTYCISDSSERYIGGSGYVVFYDKDYTITGTPVDTKSFTTPADAVYLRCTINLPHLTGAMLNEGSSRVEYEPYNPIGGYSLNINPMIPDDSIESSKLVSNGGKAQWNGKVGLTQCVKRQASLAADTSLELTDYPYYPKTGDNIAFYAEFSSFTGLLVGKGYNTSHGTWIEVDDTNVYIKEYSNSTHSTTTKSTQAHSLTFNTFIKVLYSFDSEGHLTYIVQTLGGMFKYEYTSIVWGGNGLAFARSATALTNCVLSASNDGFRKSVWVFGDSYLSFASTRWPYYMSQWGFKDMLYIGLAGGNSSSVSADLSRGLNYGCPKFALYCLGMNDGSDTNEDTPSSSWLTSIQAFISVCETNGIIPILSTIPTVPAVNNEGKTKWVRNSGYRYVDFYKAVGANSSGQWYAGYLSSDNVHPATLGGQALATQVIVDFPEIMW